MSDTARWKATVHVRGLAPTVTAGNIHDAFIPFGEIADVSLPKNENPKSGEPHRGFAYVEYEDAEDAKEAMDNMDQSDFFGRVIKVTAAKAPKNVNEGLGSSTAVWEQVSPYKIIHGGLVLTVDAGSMDGAECGQRRRPVGCSGAGRGGRFESR